MTIEEALAHATKERDAYQTKVADGKSFYQEMANFWNIVVEALEKQIPKKPISRYYANEGISVCPSCETDTSRRLLMGWEKFCPECGQKIDWEDEDDT